MFWANREQLYKLAAMSSAGDGRRLAIDEKTADDDGFRFAIPIRDTAPDIYLAERHENGYGYYQMNRDGHTKALKEDEL